MSNPIYSFKDLIKKPSLEGVFKFLGDNPNSAVWVACSIALFKGIFRPVFTMMDKKSDAETKKFAAIREGLTEIIALPIYAAVPSLVTSALIKTVYKNANDATKKIVKANTKFLTVCAATAIIPAVCNIVQPPIMNAYKKSQEAKKAKLAEVSTPTSVNKPSFSGKLAIKPQSSMYPKTNYGMRVGS